jgi:cytochrome c oxidase subunit 3
MKLHVAGDLSDLPQHAHGSRSLTWWGLMGMVVIEATVFALAVASYFYLANQVPKWPPPSDFSPDLTFGSWFTAITIASAVPNWWLKRKAESEDLRAVRFGIVLMTAIGLVLVAVRCFEFPALNVKYSASAYGSIVVTLLGLHTVHLVTDVYDSIVLAALMFTEHATGRRFVDTAENCIYWNFVVVTWIPIYLVIYFAPRWL